MVAQRKIILIIPAAGTGSRIELSYPKCLYRIKNKPIIKHILESVEGLVGKAVVITSPDGNETIGRYLKCWNEFPILTAIQEKPIGMADAVLIGIKSCNYEIEYDYLIIWGDHVSVRRETVKKTIEYHRKTEAWLTFPTAIRRDPYTHVLRDENGKEIGILEKREEDHMPEFGENDCGIFLVRGEYLKQGLQELQRKTWDNNKNIYLRLEGLESKTNEFNFLPLISMWAQRGINVRALNIASEVETIGINTKIEAYEFTKKK